MPGQKKFEKVPKKAFLLTVEGDNKLEFKAGPDGEQVPRLEMTIYSGNIIKGHWWWGDLAIDTSGMSFPKSRFPLLEEHWSRIGFMGKPIVADDHSVQVDPNTVVFLDNEEANRFIADGKKGFPFESSIRADPTMIQRLMKDEVAEVNGFQMKGPGTIWRKSTFKEGSVCMFGYDSRTSAKVFSEEEPEAEIEMMKTVLEQESLQLDGGENSMTLEELKEKHPELFAQAQKEKEDALSATHKAEIEALKKEKDKLNTTFSTELTSRDEKILKLEKQEAIRTERDRQNEADRVWKEKLSASSIPAKLHDKVRAQVVHDKFVKDEAFDTKAFGEAVDAEIKDWTESIGNFAPVRGQGGSVRTVELVPDNDENNMSEDDQAWINKMRTKAGDKPAVAA